MRLPILASILVASIVVTIPALGQEAGLVVSGVSQNDLVGLQTIDKSKSFGDQFDFAGANLLTLNVRNANATTAKIEGSVDFWLLTGVYGDEYRQIDSASALSFAQSSAAFVVDIRKLYASLFLPHADISVGRQIITFGEGLVFSPIDVFSSVNILDLSLRRSGSDVARVRVPFGDLAGLDAVAKLSSRSQGATAALKAYAHAGSFDIAGVGIYEGAQKEVVTGVTFKGDMLAGVCGELVEHWKQAGGRFFTGMAGADYSIADAWYFTAEYLFNETAQQSAAPAQVSILQTNIPLLHHHYGFADVRYKISDIMNVSASAIGDVTAKSVIITAQYFYNILQNADAIVYVQYCPESTNGLLPLSNGQMTYGLRLELAF